MTAQDTTRTDKQYIEPEIHIADVRCDESMLWITLADGRVLGAPLALSSRLSAATPEQLARWTIVGGGTGVHWPDVDEHISARVLMGHPS